MNEISYDETIALLNEMVEQRGADFVYKKVGDGCNYTYKGEADCIVGCVIVKASGVPVGDFHGFLKSNCMSGSYAGTVLDVLAHQGVVNFSPEARDLLVRVQGYQDRCIPWGVAVERAVNGLDWMDDDDIEGHDGGCSCERRPMEY